MATANKLTVLENIKWEKGVLRSFLNDPTKRKKCEKWEEMIELSDSRDCPWQYFCGTLWQGWIQFWGASSLFNFWVFL
jgi:hypothetical protein